jgi:sugar phosphate isomerase/epimerase
MQRRHFLLAPAVAAAGRAPLAAAPEPSGDLRLGVASYSLRKKSLAEAIQALKALNVRLLKAKCEAHIPLNSTPAQIAEAKRMLDDAGITLESTGNNPLTRETDIRPKFEFNKALGVKLMIIAPTLQTLPLIEKCVKEYDIKVALHNHGPEDKHFPTPSSVLKAVKSLDPRVGLCLDIGHTARTGEDFVAACAAAGPRLLDIDVKDLASATDKGSQCDVGDGVLPIAAMFKQLRRMKWNGVVHLEYEINADNPLPGMQKSFSYMRGVLAGLRA